MADKPFDDNFKSLFKSADFLNNNPIIRQQLEFQREISKIKPNFPNYVNELGLNASKMFQVKPPMADMIEQINEINAQVRAIPKTNIDVANAFKSIQDLIGKPGESLTSDQSSNIRKLYNAFANEDYDVSDTNVFDRDEDTNRPRNEENNSSKEIHKQLNINIEDETFNNENSKSKSKNLDKGTNVESPNKFLDDPTLLQHYQILIYNWLLESVDNPFKATMQIGIFLSSADIIYRFLTGKLF